MKIFRHTLLAALALLSARARAADGPPDNHRPAPANGAVAVADRRSSDWLDRLLLGDGRDAGRETTGYPFSFLYDGKPRDGRLRAWKALADVYRYFGGGVRAEYDTIWRAPYSGLRMIWHSTRYPDFPAADWVLWFENTGQQDTPILSDVKAMDFMLDEPLAGPVCYRLHRTNGAPANRTDFEPSLVDLRSGDHVALGGGGGRSSNKDFPFVKIESAKASYIIAIGWSGQWAMDLACGGDRRLHITAGLERTHFKLHPGERVRTPRILVFRQEGDTLEANARFRELIYEHYAAQRDDRPPLPTLFCNTYYLRGWKWLNHWNAASHISLIRAYAPLGLEAMVTDAGWFEGGLGPQDQLPGIWKPRKDAYPQGIGPVAAAAKQNGMVYGLWYEFERVTAGSVPAKQHPEWVLQRRDGKQHTNFLLNLGLPEVRQYMFEAVKGCMELPGFRFYRSDFNMDPLPYWRENDVPDRQGITEMKYIEGLYEFWDRLAAAWPDAFREECAAGGRRIDLETVTRMHFHQESDYWYDNEVDLARAWSLSRYLPNSTFTTPLVRLDDRSFHSTMATSMIAGWIADAPGFDHARAKQLTDTYRRLRHLLVGKYYPLTPYARDGKHWMALQFHRPDLGEGLVLVVPPRNSADCSFLVQLHGLLPQETYEVHAEIQGARVRKTGAELMRGLAVTLPPGDGGDRIVYRRVRSDKEHRFECEGELSK